MDEPSLFPVRIDEKRERVVELVQRAAVGADTSPRRIRKRPKASGGPLDVERRTSSSPGPAGQPSVRCRDGVLGDEQARRVAHLEVEAWAARPP